MARCINLFGTFEFSPSTSKVDIDALVVRYAEPTYWYKAIQDEFESNIGSKAQLAAV